MAIPLAAANTRDPGGNIFDLSVVLAEFDVIDIKPGQLLKIYDARLL